MTEPKTERENTHRRDLELILLGVVLARHDGKRSEDGQRVLDSLPHGSFGRDQEPLFDSVRNQDPRKLTAWLSERQATIEKGKDAVQSVIDCIDDKNRKERVFAILRRVDWLKRSTPTEEVKTMLKRALEELEGI